MPDLTKSPDEWSRGPYFTGFGYCTDTPLHEALHDGGRLCPPVVDDLDDDLTPIYPCACRLLPRPHRLTDPHPGDDPR